MTNKEAPRDNKGNLKCFVCGGYGYRFVPKEHGQERCPSCQGDGISRKPSYPKTAKAIPEDLDLP